MDKTWKEQNYRNSNN